jgi:hypothetical protein
VNVFLQPAATPWSPLHLPARTAHTRTCARMAVVGIAHMESFGVGVVADRAAFGTCSKDAAACAGGSRVSG